MDDQPRFRLVFAKLRAALEADDREQPPKVRIRSIHEVTAEELDEIDNLRRIVIEVTAPEPASFTTT